MLAAAARSLVALTVVLAAAACSGAGAGSPGETPTAPSREATPEPSPTPAGEQALRSAVSEGPFETVSRTYRLADIEVPGGSVPVEVQGRVVGPVTAGSGGADLPLVVLLHGYSGSCWNPSTSDTSTDWPCPAEWEPIPSAAGFDYLQQRLASQGYLTVSISGNGVNVAATAMDDDAGAQARSLLMRRHLEAWSTGEVGLVEDWPGVDLTRVLLIGHSRGGEGADRAAADSTGEDRWRVAGTVLLAPTAFRPPAQSTVPLVTVTGYCDGDVGPGPAQRLVDRPADPQLLRSAVIVAGANHNHFNREWTAGESTVPGGADDAYLEDGSVAAVCDPEGSQRISAKEQRDVALRIVGLTAAALLRDDATARAVLDGRSPGLWEPGTQVWVSAVGNGRQTRVPGEDIAPAASSPVTVALCRGVSESEDETACGFGSNEGLSLHWPDEYRGAPAPDAVELIWEQPGTVTLSLDEPLDLSDSIGVEARVAVAAGTGPVAFEVAVTDSSGQSGVVGVSGPVEAFPDDPLLPARRWGQRVFVPMPATASIDITQVTAVSLTPTAGAGHVWVIDVSAPPKRMPTK